MDDMVERVAKAIFEANRGWAHSGHEWDTRLDAEFMERHRSMARAAIEAMKTAPGTVTFRMPKTQTPGVMRYVASLEERFPTD